jgi:hypothetical protein
MLKIIEEGIRNQESGWRLSASPAPIPDSRFLAPQVIFAVQRTFG